MTPDELVSIASSLAKRYRRKCWWGSITDMQQEALAAMLRAHQTYIQNPEGDERGYLWKAGVYAIKNMLIRESAPVSATSHTLEDLKGLVRVQVSRLDRVMIDVVRTDEGTEVVMRSVPARVEADPADEALADHNWLKRARDRVRAVLNPLPDSALAREVLLGYLTPREAASEAGVGVKTVYRAVRRAKLAIENDRKLYELTRERVTGK